MKNKRALTVLALTGSAILFMQSCSKDNPVETPTVEHAAVKFRMTDAPAAYAEVNVDVKQVRIHVAGNSGTDAWIELPTHAGVYNLLDLQNGIDTTIVDSTLVPAGKVTQIRFVLGSKCSLMTSDSVPHDLKVPSGQESGLKLVGPINLPANQTLAVKLDFDAEKSIVVKGNGEYGLEPVIKVLP